MHREKPISSTHEMYLKTLYEVRGRHQVAKSRDLAEALGVSPATVSGVLKKLKDLDLVDHEPYGVVSLTPAGVAVAECLLRSYDTLRDVLVEVFGVDPDTAAADACMMEHGASPATVKRMIALLERVRSGRLVIPDDARTPAEHGCEDCEAASTCLAASPRHSTPA
ncbi:MAG TPA: metal-dependent transcriptional regulator [Candidatus Polarisedimenticolaceae bacterium]